jgi:predicted nucleotidyltransferase
MVRADLQDILKQFRKGLEEIYGDRLVKVILYGSQARGDARPDSDVDVLVVLRSPGTEKEADRVAGVEAELCIEYGVLIATVAVTEEKFEKQEEPLYWNVQLEGVPV